MRPAFFIDRNLQQKFERDGFVVVPFLGKDDVAALNDLYRQVQPESVEGFCSTTYNADVEEKKKVYEQIALRFTPVTNVLLKDIRPLGGSFLCKTPGEKSYMPPHQDWTVVDESTYDSLTIWVPLTDTNEENGAIRVLPGSHRFSSVLRSPNLHGAFTSISNEVYSRMKSLNLKAGEAIIFSQALLHASPPNRTDKDRVAVTFGFIPASAELFFYHLDEASGEVQKFKVKDDFFLAYDHQNKKPSDAELVDSFNYNFQQVTADELNSLIFRYNIEHSKSLKMKRLFKDDDVQAFFNENGYVRMQMLDSADVKELYDYYFTQNLTDHSGYGFNLSIEDDNKEKVARIRKKIFEVALPKVMPHLADAKVIAGSYVVKEYNPKSVVPPHQDWTFVDNEGENYSVTCWIPLVDTNMKNGYMGVVKGSHTIFNTPRVSPSPQAPSPLMNHMFATFPYMEMFEMKPGEALIFDFRTFHGSTPNVTQQPRVAVGLGFTQADSVLCHYSLKLNGKKDTLNKYFIDEDFLLHYDNSTISKMYDRGEAITGYKVAEEIPFNWQDISSDELIKIIKEKGNQFNAPVCEYLASLYNFNMDGTKKTEESSSTVGSVGHSDNQPASQGKADSQNSDNRTFFQKYTPLNIIREIKGRVLS